MKNTITALALLCATVPALAQTSQFDPKEGAPLDGQTIVKANLTGIAFGNYSLAVERILNRSFSFQLSASLHPESKLPFASAFKSLGEDTFSNIKLNTFSITPEVRWYLSKSGYGKGFYIAPYYRYEQMSFSGVSYDITIDNNSRKPDGRADLTAKVNTHSFGLAIGAQWLLGKKKNIVLDWTIIGGHYGAANINLDGKAVSLTGARYSEEDFKEIQQDVDRGLRDISLLKVNGVSYDVEKQSVYLKGAKSPWAFVRFGLSIGYRF